MIWKSSNTLVLMSSSSTHHSRVSEATILKFSSLHGLISFLTSGLQISITPVLLLLIIPERIRSKTGSRAFNYQGTEACNSFSKRPCLSTSLSSCMSLIQDLPLTKRLIICSIISFKWFSNKLLIALL